MGHEIYMKTSTLTTSYPNSLSLVATSRRLHPQLKVDGGPRALLSPLRYLRKGVASVHELRLDSGDKLKHNLSHSMDVLNACPHLSAVAIIMLRRSK